MRTFYIFKINNEFAILTKDCPFNLYKTMEGIYYFNGSDLKPIYKMFKYIANPFNKKNLNLKIFELHRHNLNYTKFNNIHMIHNYYTDEETELTVKNVYLILKSTIATPSFFNDLKDKENLFVCDFQNKDYFWLDQLLI